MAMLTLNDAAHRLSMTPLQLVVQCALHGIPCDAGTVEEDALPALGSVHVVHHEAAEWLAREQIASGEATEQERRQRVVRRVVEKLTKASKFWPARIEKRSAARGFAGSDVGLAVRAVDVLLECGLLAVESHGGREPRVGLDGSRRQEIADIVSGDAIRDAHLRAWIEQG